MEQEKLPGASNALLFGILSIVLTLFCCGPFGGVFSIIGLTNANKAEKIQQQSEGQYAGYNDVKTGKVLSYIGLVIAVIYLICLVLFFGTIIALLGFAAENGDLNF